MPVYLLTYHAYLSWLPDRPRGYVHHTQGLQPTDKPLADAYRGLAKDEPVVFTRNIQRLLIDETLTAQRHQRFQTRALGTDPSHIHALLSWEDDRSWSKLRNGLKQSYTRKLNATYGRRQWFSENASRKRVRDKAHYNYLKNEYLPDHPGWKWDRAKGTCA